MNTVCL